MLLVAANRREVPVAADATSMVPPVVEGAVSTAGHGPEAEMVGRADIDAEVAPPAGRDAGEADQGAKSGAARQQRPRPHLAARIAGRISAIVTGPGLAITWARRMLALVLGVLWWQWAVENELNFIINFENVASPLEVWNSFTAQLHGSKFYVHVLVSVQRVAIAYAFAAVIGIALGLAMGRSRVVYDLVIPYVEILRPIPAVTWIPLAILMWPTEESSIIYITFLGALFPIILNTVAGVDQTPEVLVRAARSLGARRMQIFRHVVLPAALPSIATGLTVGMGVAWFSLLAGEIISGQYGIGYFTWTSYQLIKYPEIIVGMLTIGLLGTISTFAVQAATAPFLRWQKRQR